MTLVTERPEKAKLSMSGASLEWIAADTFTVDPSYDRPAHQGRINHMAENWDDKAIGVVIASRRGDLLYLIDGQHRVGALKKQNRKTELVPTLVFEGLSVADEAELFVTLNKNRKALLPSELFKASLIEGDKGAIAIKEVMDGLNLKLESYDNDPRSVKCVNTVWRIYRAMGAPGIDAVLGLVLVTWGDDPPEKNAFNQNLILVLARILFFAENRLDLDRLRTVLSTETPDVLLSRAGAMRAMGGGTATRVLEDLILTSYNKGFPTAKQIAPATLKGAGKDPFTTATRFRREGTKDDGDK